MEDKLEQLKKYDLELKNTIFLPTIYLTRKSYIKCEGFGKYIWGTKHLEIVDIPTEII
jgi:hypothetical protein